MKEVLVVGEGGVVGVVSYEDEGCFFLAADFD